jgi:putative heme-binding domain-containing protein
MDRICVVSALLALGAPLFAQRDARVPDPDPELERRTFQVAEGLDVTLFAADPMLAKPIHMNFDARGRLWIAASETYPHIRPGDKANDKILILEDTDGDGRADRTTVFLDGLLIPTGVEPGDGGAYIANSTELLHVAETPEGKAGAVRVLLSGFGTEDTHHILHSLRWGPDGRLYMNQSIYIHSHIETPYGPRRLNAGGIWAFRPSTHQLDIFARGWINSWGHVFDHDGQSFVTDGAGGEGVNWCVPGGYYPTAIGPHAQRILHGLNPGHPKYCGAEIVSGRHFPDDWQGDLITNDFRGHRVVRFKLREEGTGFAAQMMPDVIRSNHPAFRPVDVKIGPDGALYIADWYNPIIQHGEVDFRDPRRDKTHGRIWRVTVKGRLLVPRPRLHDASIDALFEQLRAPEQWTRHFARRTLAERGAAIVRPHLDHRIRELDPRAVENQRYLLELLWLQQSLGLAPSLAEHLATAQDPRIRAAAMRALSGSANPSAKERLLRQAVRDEHPRVRLEAVRALATIPHAAAAQAAAETMQRPMDSWLDYALWLTLRELEPFWMPRLKSGDVPFRDVPQLVFALRAVDARAAVPLLVELLQSGKAGSREADLWDLLATVGGPDELALVFSHVLAAPTDRSRLLLTLERAARQRRIQPKGDLTKLWALLAESEEATRVTAARLAGLWQLADGIPRLSQLVKDDPSSAVRKAAIAGLAEIPRSEAIAKLDELAGAPWPKEIRRFATEALLRRDVVRAATRAADLLAVGMTDAETSELISAFVQQKGGPDALARSLSNREMPTDTAKVAFRSARSGSRETESLVAAIKRAGRLDSPRRAWTPEQKAEILRDVVSQGDPMRGEKIYRRSELACQKCHAIGGSGGLAGPDLISLGASAPLDYILDSLLEPKKQVKENYHSLQIETKSGQQLSGIKVGETETELILRDAEDREVRIPRAEIDDQRVGGSIMPEGLTDSLTRSELVDLVRFLSELGKVGGRLTVGSERFVRTWRVLEATPEAHTAVTRQGIQAPASDPSRLTWRPAYSTVSGHLPMDGLPTIEVRHGLEGSRELFSFLRCQFTVTKPGRIRLSWNRPDGVSAWLDAAAIPVKETTELEVKAGLHTLTLAVDWLQRPEGIRLELVEPRDSPAQFRLDAGK